MYYARAPPSVCAIYITYGARSYLNHIINTHVLRMCLHMLNTWVIILCGVIVNICILFYLINYFKFILIFINIYLIKKGVISCRFLSVLNRTNMCDPHFSFIMELLTQCNFVS